MREEKFHIYLNDDEYSRDTDGVDDVLCKVLSTKKRKLKIKYI